MVYGKGRPKGAIGITASKRLEKSTERDSSQFELVNTAISGDISSRKGIYKIGKKGGRLKATPKTITKPISPLKKQKRKEVAVKTPEKTMIRIANRQRKRFEIDLDSDDEELIELSSDNEVEIDDEDKDEADKDEAEKKAEVEKSQISAAGRPLRNTTLPVINLII